MKRGRWPWGRIVAGIAAAFFLLLAIPFITGGVDVRHRADLARVAEPIRLKVDLSKPGEYEGTFRHTFTAAHSKNLQIETDSQLMPKSARESREKGKEILAGLSGRVSIIGSDGSVVKECDFTAESSTDCWSFNNAWWIPLIDLGSFPAGVYTLKLKVDHGAPQLANVRHVLIAKYGLCGMEYLHSQMMMWLGIGGCVIAGLLIIAIVVVTVAKRGRAANYVCDSVAESPTDAA